MTCELRAERAEALERRADAVAADDLKPADTELLRRMAELADRRSRIVDELIDAVGSARASNRSWSEIGVMLGVSKQAAQGKYGPLVASA